MSAKISYMISSLNSLGTIVEKPVAPVPLKHNTTYIYDYISVFSTSL
jgi:hypothetical protein